MSHFVFIESNTTGTGRLAVERLLAQGDQVTFITRQPRKYPFLNSSAAGLRVLEVETNDVAAVKASVRELQRRATPDALVTFSTFYVPTVAEVAADSGFRYLNPRTALDCHDKYRSRQVLRGAGLPTPDFWLVTTDEELLRVSETARYPCVVKPIAESGSNGVRLVNDREEFLAHARMLRARRVNEREQPLEGHLLIESLLSGPEFSVETITLGPGRTHVIGVTAKHLSTPPHFVEMGHDFPADLEPKARQALEEATVAALDAVGFDWGPAHTELRFTPTGPVVVEINPRLAGGMIPELVRYATGIDQLTVMLDMLLGKPVSLQATRQEYAAIRFLTAPRRGRITRVSGVEEARRLPGVRDVSVDKGVGSVVRFPENAIDRLGFVIASSPHRAEVIAGVNQARALIELQLEDVKDA
ncbi:ATP-grasp domain-containing protein [Melittangium boletus]|uniref:Carboxylate--amine ligase n=1 Tax=Melittangium boletus DSM 14713 TaxID=1294270 RepID=A0A250ITQ4_9BACT|nr:ATP-grasp domain-containing protein [Melittangium boletus]ATB34306.1 carboxylate--amine ligase [Melittangium boletus DSM 14713]